MEQCYTCLVKKTGPKKSKHVGFFARINQFFPYHIPRVVGSIIVVTILMIGVLPSKGLGTRSQAKDAPSVRPDVLAVMDKPEAVVGSQEIVAKEAQPELIGVKVPILMYHYIENPGHDKGRDKLLVPPALLEEQLKFLRDNGWTTITLDDLSSGLKDPKTLPAKPIILTFDDGYTDFYYQAFPILQKYQAKATIYVLSRGAAIAPGFYMSESQLIELSKSPLITIAAHTQDHRDLKAVNETYQRHEIFGSKQELESLIGKPVKHFAYPYGDFNDSAVKLVKEAGFETAASTIISTRNSESSRFTLRRVRIGNLPISWFAAQLAR